MITKLPEVVNQWRISKDLIMMMSISNYIA
jgi:hypothetical protein